MPEGTQHDVQVYKFMVRVPTVPVLYILTYGVRIYILYVYDDNTPRIKDVTDTWRLPKV